MLACRFVGVRSDRKSGSYPVVDERDGESFTKIERIGDREVPRRRKCRLLMLNILSEEFSI